MEQSITPKLFRINTGSCNGCDVEFVAAMFIPKFNGAELGIELVYSPAEANLILVTGPLTTRCKAFVEETLGQVKEPYIVVSTGTCSISGGIFKNSYSLSTTIDELTHVDVTIAGCPPRPQAVTEGLARGIELLQQKAGLKIQNNSSVFADFKAPETFRGKISVDDKLCTGCKTCETVCPANAIKIEATPTGFSHTVWHNTCCFCGNCAYYCPTGAISNSYDFKTVRDYAEKYSHTNRIDIEYRECDECKEKYTPPSHPLLEKSLAPDSHHIDKLEHLCPSCRKNLTFTKLYI